MTECYNARFLDNNHADSGAWTDGRVTVSSQDSTLIGSNAATDDRNTYWQPRSDGYFEITTFNNKIYINDGSDKTGTITVGTYTSDALITEIAAQLNSVSSSWFATYSTSQYKFFLSHTGSATLKLSTTTDAIWNTLGFLSTTDSTSDNWEGDEIRIHTSEWYKLDAGVAQDFTSFASICPIDEVYGPSSNAVLKLQANNMDEWASPPLEKVLTRNDRGVFEFLDTDSTITDRVYRWWRYEILDPTNPGGPSSLRFSNIYIGPHTELNRNVASGFTKSKNDPTRTLTSEFGNQFFDLRVKSEEFSSIPIGSLSISDRRALEQLFYDKGTSEAFYLAIDPNVQISNDLEDLTRFVRFATGPQFRHLFRDLYITSISIREVI